MRWAKNRIVELKIHSRLGGNLRLRTNAPLPDAQGFSSKKARGENANPFYARAQIKPPQLNTSIRLPQLVLSNSYLIDVATEAGRDYLWQSTP